jgi:hypothetical protein
MQMNNAGTVIINTTDPPGGRLNMTTTEPPRTALVPPTTEPPTGIVPFTTEPPDRLKATTTEPPTGLLPPTTEPPGPGQPGPRFAAFASPEPGSQGTTEPPGPGGPGGFLARLPGSAAHTTKCSVFNLEVKRIVTTVKVEHMEDGSIVVTLIGPRA